MTTTRHFCGINAYNTLIAYYSIINLYILLYQSFISVYINQLSHL